LILRARRGLYVVAPRVSRKEVDKFLLANHIYGPSYISLETALEYHGLIPEAVYEVRSVTPFRGKEYDTMFGRFLYRSVPKGYFKTGISMTGTDEQRYLMASPEKALCDLLMLTSDLRIQSARAMREYLEGFLRIDMERVASFDQAVVMECINIGRKKTTMERLLEVIKDG